ncbi:MAG TPA: GDSL-type esterase/lipase family protein [Acidimicrobiales bacterium]|nr:GDSL-type esterase/lipase family protein [Acidimicrobiales bacterium]
MAWGYGTASNATVREVATLKIGGSALRIRISNLFGNQPLVVGDATVAVDAGGATLAPGTLRPLTFGGNPGVTIPIGGFVYSDPVPMTASAGQVVAASVYISNTDLMTVHPCCDTTASYFSANGAGNLTANPSQTGFAGTSPWPRLVDAVDVLQTSGNGSIVVIGDSITDGYHSAQRWTDVLQQRIDLLPVASRLAVINEGITANTLTAVVPSDASDGGGPPGVSRLARDALDQSGVTEIVLFLGTNDLYFGAGSQQVIAGLQQAITTAHQAGVRIIGVTLLPREAGEEAWSPAQQSALQQVDDWILTSGAFDGVLNFATPVADVYNGACAPTAMFPPYDSGDHLHPNAAGQTAMANSVDTTVLGLPAAPTVPPMVAVTPTPGCAGVLGIPSATAPAPTTTTTMQPTTRSRSPSSKPTTT